MNIYVPDIFTSGTLYIVSCNRESLQEVKACRSIIMMFYYDNV